MMCARQILVTLLSISACGPSDGPIDAQDQATTTSSPLPQSDSIISAASLNIKTGYPAPDTLFVLAHVRTASGRVLRLEAIGDSMAIATRIIADRSIPPLNPGEFVAVGGCTYAGKPDIAVAAVVEPGRDGAQERVRTAWRVDLPRRAITDVPTAMVDCVDEEALELEL